MTGPGNRETPITSWDRGLVQADPDAAIREIRELRAARVRAEEALREAVKMARAFGEHRLADKWEALAAVPEKDKPASPPVTDSFWKLG